MEAPWFAPTAYPPAIRRVRGCQFAESHARAANHSVARWQRHASSEPAAPSGSFAGLESHTKMKRSFRKRSRAHVFGTCVLLACLSCDRCPAAEMPARRILSFDSNWLFTRGDSTNEVTCPSTLGRAAAGPAALRF